MNCQKLCSPATPAVAVYKMELETNWTMVWSHAERHQSNVCHSQYIIGPKTCGTCWTREWSLDTRQALLSLCEYTCV